LTIIYAGAIPSSTAQFPKAMKDKLFSILGKKYDPESPMIQRIFMEVTQSYQEAQNRVIFDGECDLKTVVAALERQLKYQFNDVLYR
jgi:hypothetical protein